jgi:hypothetical protein
MTVVLGTGQERSIDVAYLRDGCLWHRCWAVHAAAMVIGMLLHLYKATLVAHDPAPTHRPSRMQDIKTSSSQLPLSSPRDTASLPGMFLLPIAPIAVAYPPISSVDIQHLTIPAALFTDAVDPE